MADQVSVNTSLPRDDDSAPIQVLGPRSAGTVHRTTTEAASANVALATGTNIVRIASNVAVWVSFGGAAITAAAADTNSMMFPAGAEVFHLRDSSFTYIAARSVSGEGNGLVTATRME